MEYKIIGYKYLTEQEAADAVNNCNQFYNIVDNSDNVTKNWCEYTIDDNNVFFITQDKTLVPVLGQPYEFEVNFNEE